MSYRVKFSQTVAEALSAFHPEIKKQLKAALHDIAQKPYQGKELQEELFGFYSYRFKRYRILSQVGDENQAILVYHFGHRRNVYKLFEQLLQRAKRNGKPGKL